MTEPDPSDTEGIEAADRAALDGADVGAVAPAEPAVPVTTDDAGEIDSGPTSADYSIAFSPRNVAVGLAIVAGLVAFVASRHRKRRADREDD
jgi:hypothetical protein